MNESKCKSCGAAILWAITEAGKRIPLDVEPHPHGNIRLNADGTCYVAAVVDDPELFPTLHRSHFVTCPDHAKWRKSRDG